MGNLSPISNLAEATTLGIKVVFSDDFESGSANWTIAGSDGSSSPWPSDRPRGTMQTFDQALFDLY